MKLSPWMTILGRVDFSGVLTVHLEYGSYLSETKVLGPVATSMTTIAALLPLDVPTQVKWHMRGLIRNGGSEAEVLETLELASSVVDLAEITLKGGIPKLSDLGDRLF